MQNSIRSENIVVAKDKVLKVLSHSVDTSVIDLVDALIEHAHISRASDIHMDPLEESLRVRFRIDGVLQDVHSFSKHLHDEVISRIKILSGLRTDEHQAAQDGRFRYAISGIGAIDVRVSLVPAYYGENAVLRLLSDRAEEFTLDTLGFSDQNKEKILRAIRKPHGMILATGPTGSGKTTTLYALLKLLNTRDVSIITIEDPIEYAMEGVEQVQINPRSGLTFASGLRSFLRQDPNIIMVGEIRDTETAGLAVNTSLTGHLLLSTLHTNDAATTLPRLLDMKVEPYLAASTVNIAIGQRLVRKICSECKTNRVFTDAERKRLAEISTSLFDAKESHKAEYFYGKGCDACNMSGYYGRIGIHEVLVVDRGIQEAILDKASASEIKGIAISGGMITMTEDGIAKARKGLTTLEDILRVVHE